MTVRSLPTSRLQSHRKVAEDLQKRLPFIRGLVVLVWMEDDDVFISHSGLNEIEVQGLACHAMMKTVIKAVDES